MLGTSQKRKQKSAKKYKYLPANPYQIIIKPCGFVDSGKIVDRIEKDVKEMSLNSDEVDMSNMRANMTVDVIDMAIKQTFIMGANSVYKALKAKSVDMVFLIFYNQDAVNLVTHLYVEAKLQRLPIVILNSSACAKLKKVLKVKKILALASKRNEGQTNRVTMMKNYLKTFEDSEDINWILKPEDCKEFVGTTIRKVEIPPRGNKKQKNKQKPKTEPKVDLAGKEQKEPQEGSMEITTT
eukprot:CAMPEP_0114992092 /NCGR_PEP_ID=MMETSP0216-20121206/11745_1 /TAXON_ID=223996 /ORGANISM="Protocruzia adherens, Strain Boccale" /LENGTH=238 /DNA_ID=CAMNT_0002355511 /DNA_START=26 /DNA_END=742 /DNA_ORIENTATION=-